MTTDPDRSTSATGGPAQTTEAYLYGFPLVFNLDQVTRYVTEGVGANPAAPFNTFSHARKLAGPQDTFVTINNDTVYSMAQLDLSVGPVTLHVPDTAGRYYVLQFVDAWTNNFAYVGHRATGTEEGDFLLVPPGWEGEFPQHHTVIRFPTTVASIVGRWSVASDDDLPTVHLLQDATTLTPVDGGAEPVGLAVPDPAVPEELIFLEKLRVWSQQFPPPDRDRPLQDGLAPLGTTHTGSSPYLTLPEDERESLAAGLEGRQGCAPPCARFGPQPAGQWLETHVPCLRLQPGLLRGRCPRRRPLQDRRPEAPHRRTRSCRHRGSLGQPPLRSGLHHDLRR